MIENDDIALRFWDREIHDPTGSMWMADPLVRAYINRSISGSPGAWPMDWFQSWLGGRTFRRGLSIGCGGGTLERDMIRRGLVDEMDAFDGSAESIRVAKEEAEKAGYADRIHYSIGDFNEPRLPSRTYDIVFMHQAMHHVAKLEKLYRAIMNTLTPDGLLYLDEYVGPSRHEWNDENFAASRALFASFPAEVRRDDHLPLPIQPHDPSEAIRSSEILPELAIGFDVLEKRDYGGNVLSVMYSWLHITPQVVERLMEEEERLLRSGEPSLMTVVVARPKRGLAGTMARARYFVVPKVKRIGREVARLARHGESERR